jgi:long-chain fatty acid transport protein
MANVKPRLTRLGAFLALGVLAAAPGFAAGFSIFEQGSKAMGMGGAFTAQADDPTAMFHNAAGLAFQDERAFRAGFTYVTSTVADFEGADPFPGADARGEQTTLQQFPPHAYWVQPLGERVRFGLGIESPFGLATEWDKVDDWPGRYLSSFASLRSVDLNPTLAWRANDSFGIGLGIIGRFSDVELERRVGRNNPFTQTVADIAEVQLQSDFDSGYGWNVGLLHKWNNSFSWGFSYRSKIEIDYQGDARLTQIPTGFPAFDTAVSRALPFGVDLPIETSIEFPDQASLGLLFAITPNLFVETDLNWMGWSSFDQIVINGTNATASAVFNPETSTIHEDWEDVYSYRLGVRYRLASGSELRFGYIYDETPQPDETVSPLLPDANRNGITLGYGGHLGRFPLDLALLYLPFDERTTDVNQDDFNGTYNTTAWLLGVTLGF